MLEYLKNRILDELADSVDYMKKAVEFKGTNTGCVFRILAEAEADHAGRLTSIFNQNEKKEDNDEEHCKMVQEIMDAYVKRMASLEALKKIYYTV